MILSAKFPIKLKKIIFASFKELKTKFVAVRSSATAEDSSAAAWAGQLDSFLNTTEKDLFKNIQRCWASLFTPRAIFYRFEKGLHTTKISVAVVVQKMVRSEKSGIAFSVHPVTQDYNQLIIEAGFGLGEAIVSGQITPDSYVVTKKPELNILDINVNEQSRALYGKPEGGNEWRDLGVQGKLQVLTDEEILELSKIVINIERHYGFPCDIEWAYENKKFYIVQSRPITTLMNERIAILPKINSVEFWARESDMPLFWLTDPKHNLGSSGLFFYKKGMYHCYYLNGSEAEKAKEGFKYFSLKKNRVKYVKDADKMLRTIAAIFKAYGRMDLKKKEGEELKRLFGDVLKQLEKYIGLYTKTEAANMGRFDAKYGFEDFKEVAKARLKLRKGGYNLFYVLIGKLLAEVARRNHLRVKGDLFFYNLDELQSLLDGRKLPETIIAERKKGFVVFREKKISTILTGKDSDKLWKQITRMLAPADKKIIKGSIVYRGVASGRVRIIFQKTNSKYNIKDGEILVTDMTKPDMLTACKKAAAIITDEGGITCHAAIIAREMKKPCVIGTKNATQILHDGDLVEVDANNGVVKIIKQV